MKTVKKYKEMTVDEAVENLRENGMKPIDGVAGRDSDAQAWDNTIGSLRYVAFGDTVYPFVFGVGPYKQAAIVAEENEWEIGDCVEVINDNHAPQLEAGAKGIVFHLNSVGNPFARQTSPNPYGNGMWPVDAAGLRPWTPGYGYLPNGERVPDKDGWEMVPEDGIHNIDDSVGICWRDGTMTRVGEFDRVAIATYIKTGTIRAVYRRKQPKMVPFDGPEDLLEWPVIWARKRTNPVYTCSVAVICEDKMLLSGGYEYSWKLAVNELEISPDRRNWQTAGKEVAK